ncbi:MAG: DUF2817 domain-containing protein [Acidobacteriia bacterium]|nr:DUF2817 domain-containing protein [Terriglobia bacterium]
MLDTILAGYTAVPQDTTAERLVDGTEMWFIPIGNPHGNANNTRYNSRNVDCNRNFWGPEGSDAPPAWSEAETAAIRDLTEAATADHAKKRFALSISFHEGETVFNSVWNYTAAAPTDEPIFWSSRTGGTGCGSQTVPNCPTLAPHGLAQAYKDGCTMPGFWYTEGYDWFGTRGDTNDWAYGAWTDLDATVELNSTKTPPAAEIPTYCAEHRQAVLNYMLKAFQGIHGVMTDQSTGAPLDGTVTVTATASAEIPVPHDYQAVFTDPLAGDFHRVLEPGTYTVVCDAPGYRTTILTGVTVTADTRTIADCPMTVMGLVYYSSTVTDACSGGGAYSGDGILDAGEDATLPLTVGNLGSISATSVQGTLSTNAPGITITRGTASFADVPVNETVESSPPHFRFSVGTGVPCGTVIPFSLHLTAAQGAWDDSFSVAVGQTSAGPSETLLIRRFGGTQGGAGLAHVDSNDEPQGTCTMHACDAIPPTIVCPTPETVECQADGRSEVDLPHATATDVCQPGGLVISNTFTPNGADASGSYPLGTTVVTFTASDASGNRASCRTTVTVRDTIAPILTAVASPSVLWPPSHDMVAVHATVVATDACDPSPSFVLASVTSSEPDEAPGDGDGHTTGDIQDATIGTADLDVLLRAERDGNGPGRTYTIEYRARDASGNVGAGRATVEVPHDLGAARPVATEMAKKASAHGR